LERAALRLALAFGDKMANAANGANGANGAFGLSRKVRDETKAERWGQKNDLSVVFRIDGDVKLIRLL
jgi:hypothetical protein